MEEMPSLNMPVQRIKVAILPLDLFCSGPITHSGEILTTGKSHRKKPDSYILLESNENVQHEIQLFMTCCIPSILFNIKQSLLMWLAQEQNTKLLNRLERRRT
jgi:hypothetical protein